MKTIYRLLIIPLLFSVVISCASNRDNKKLAYSHFQVGVSLVTRGQTSKGLEQLLIARDLDSSNPLILNHLGLAYFFLKEYEHSILALKSAVSEKPTYSEAHNNLGRVYIEIKDFTLARKHLNQAAADLTYPNKDKVWLNIGLSYFMQNQYKKSQNYFLKSLSANRKSCLAYNFYGRSQLELEHFKKAAKALDQAIYHCRTKKFDEPHYYGAISLFRMGYKSKAIARLQEGRKLYPNGPNKQRMEEMINLMKITETK